MSIWQKIKNALQLVSKQLKDWKNWIIFIVVMLVVGSEVWIPGLIGVLTGNAWWYGVAAVCWAFWLAPFTPFLPLCLAVTFAVRKIFDKIKKRPKN